MFWFSQLSVDLFQREALFQVAKVILKFKIVVWIQGFLVVKLTQTLLDFSVKL